ncbi:hypothetical protein KVR01_011465 [Diaporthe batatas]|uniref:uncharacterized protein n=1 Tax=Diaporthe batatas TaxID=748121 RepID=UPI001D036795|nr:uncharacterized protein KVR01_011465 [Diaporthe batatas]KAG8159022.1 hypothetical protein KVR01_011465 [Diaporthe batatas]
MQPAPSWWQWPSQGSSGPPARLFPFVANIKMETGCCPTPREYRGCEVDLWDVFAAYEPAAVGRRICHKRSSWADWLGGCEGGCGACIWVSVPTRALVEQIVRDFHGRQMRDGRLVVKDTSIGLDEGEGEGDPDEGSKDEQDQDG